MDKIHLTDQAEIRLSYRIVLETIHRLGTQESWLHSVDIQAENLVLTAFYPGLYPHQGMDALLTAWLAGADLCIRLPEGRSGFLKELSYCLTKVSGSRQIFSYTEGPLPRSHAIFSELGTADSAKFEPYIHQPWRNTLPGFSILAFDSKPSAESMGIIRERIVLHGGHAPDNIKLVLMDNEDTLNELLTYFREKPGTGTSSYWMNNYEYWKAAFMINRVAFMDTPECLFRQSDQPSPYPGVIHYDDTGLSAAQAAAVAGEGHALHEMLVAGQEMLLIKEGFDGWAGRIRANVNWLKNIFQGTNEG
ncbi:MAG: hypothetical protein KA053_02130 [Lentimicrobiaceae bacterium]|nr:hypothetical protein [Lentimicrobiaceae bacterium]